MMRSLLAAFQFLTILPVRAQFEARDMGRSIPYFPVVGLAIGLAAAGLDRFVFQPVVPPLVQCVLCVIVLAASSGCLHLDGLADTADGFLSSRPRERILEIMRDSRIGTMGVLALFAVIALKLSALVSLDGSLRWGALLLAPVAGRCMLVLSLCTQPYARSEGLASLFMEHRKRWHAVWAVLFLLGAGVWALSWRGISLVLVAAAAALVFNVCARRKIGGITGDSLGAVCELTEAAILLAATVQGL